MAIVKEEIIALVEELRIKQDAADKFVEHYTSFLKDPRCKKGIIEFLNELFGASQTTDYPINWYLPYDELMLKLNVGKSDRNSYETRFALEKSSVKTRGFAELQELREKITNMIADYIIQIQAKLDESTLVDANERQLYLRRAVARFAEARAGLYLVSLTVDQWAEVRPADWVDYLNTDIQTLVQRLRHEEDFRWAGIKFDSRSMDNPLILQSIITYLDYLDTFLVY